ncbi:MAG: ATP-binding cassette domain-containing protein [Pseudomonadota bacterium]
MSEPPVTELVLECRGLGRDYRDGDLLVPVLKSVDLELQAGEKLAIVGASGSGKSTLLNLLGGLDKPSAGSVKMGGKDLSTLDERSLCDLRNRSLGFVYQFHHLLPEFDACENVAMPLLIAGLGRRAASDRARAVLARVGMDHRLQHRPGQLSGGERQRVAIARALVAQPDCVLMDEPTGNLDPQSAQQVLALIDELGEEDSAFIVVTHDQQIANHMHRTLVLSSGVLSSGASSTGAPSTDELGPTA